VVHQDVAQFVGKGKGLPGGRMVGVKDDTQALAQSHDHRGDVVLKGLGVYLETMITGNTLGLLKGLLIVVVVETLQLSERGVERHCSPPERRMGNICSMMTKRIPAFKGEVGSHNEEIN